MEELGISRWCSTRECTLKCGGVVVAEDIPTPIEAGESIVVTISQRPTTSDVASFMQQGRPESSTSRLYEEMQEAIDIPAEGHACENFRFNIDAPAFFPARPDLSTFPEDIQDLYHAWHQRTFAWQRTERRGMIITWFNDQHDPARRVCQQPRNVVLTEAIHTWERSIQQAWQDMIGDEAIAIHLVRPSPPDMPNEVVAHVIVVQRPQATLCSMLFTLYDYTTPGDWTFRQLAMTMHEHVFLEQIIHSFGRTQQCLLARPTQTCHAWHEAYRLQLGTPWPGRDGHGIVMTFTFRQDGHSLLQLGQAISRASPSQAEEEEATAKDDSGRQTRGTVAHDHGPEHKRSLNLSSLLSIDGQTKVVHLVAGHQGLQLPNFLEVSPEADHQEIEVALLQWGLRCLVLRFGEHDRFLCFDRTFQLEERQWHYMISNEDVTDSEGCILHSHNAEMTVLDLMKLLDELGYARAVILEAKWHRPGIHHVIFCNSVPRMPDQELKHKMRTPWPRRTIWTWDEGPLYAIEGQTASTCPQQVRTEFDLQDVQNLIAAGPSFLQTDLTGIELPEYIKDSLTPALPGRAFDRWLIFTDGSSQATTRRMAPQQGDELGKPDTWAMLVLGEAFQEDGSSVIEMIGWCAHPVRYDEHGHSFTHAQHIGAEVAERQALIWAGIWRLMQNSLTPTVFCCDSLTCGEQAFGNMGTAHPDASYRLVRGIFQCLQHGLPQGHLVLHHVYSHTGDPYNEFVDTIAKLEMDRSFHHPWPAIDMQKWNHILPHLWLLHGASCGMPIWSDGALPVPAPQLPETFTSPSRSRTNIGELRCTLSLASANVLSISRNPDGHAGKLHYLFAQMKDFGINILGIQEGRAEEGRTSSNHILRLMAGHEGHQCGVELWVSLDQPYGVDNKGNEVYFKEHHFQVVYKDARRFLVNVQAEGLQCFIFVAHAPHSGRPRDERESWWEFTTELLCRHTHAQSCIWLMDANAEPGTADGEVVCKKGLRTSANTIFMREALQKLRACPLHGRSTKALCGHGQRLLAMTDTASTMWPSQRHGSLPVLPQRSWKSLT